MDPCARCRKPPAVCICDRVRELPVGVRIVVLQHPQEQDRVLGTAPILEVMVGATRAVGLSWPNLASVAPDAAGRWAAIWPNQLPRPLTPEERDRPFLRLGDGPLEGLVVLDGTWSQAKALWWRNPWLLKLDRIVLQPREPSIYGRLRREPRPEWISTLEAVADALVGIGEPEEVRGELRRAMRTMVQRARDHAA